MIYFVLNPAGRLAERLRNTLITGYLAVVTAIIHSSHNITFLEVGNV